MGPGLHRGWGVLCQRWSNLAKFAQMKYPHRTLGLNRSSTMAVAFFIRAPMAWYCFWCISVVGFPAAIANETSVSDASSEPWSSVVYIGVSTS